MKLEFSQPIKISDKDTGESKKFIVKKYRLPNGLLETFFIDAGRDSVEVLAQTKDGNFITVSQYRPSDGKLWIELPGGGVDDNELPTDAAARELSEETGFTSQLEPVHLVSVPYSPYSVGKRHMFFIGECEKTSKQDLDPKEFVTIKQWDKASFLDELVLQGKVRGWETFLLASHKGIF